MKIQIVSGIVLVAVMAFLDGSMARAAPTAEQLLFFDEEVYPILEASCFKCHGGKEKIKGGFRVTSRGGLLRGGDLGAGIDLQNPPASLVLDMLSYKDEEHEMPPKGKLPQEQLDVLAEWVAMEAPYNPEKEIHGDPEQDDRKGFVLDEEARNWWAYQPVREPAIPEVADPLWCDHPIDALLYEKLRQHTLVPNAPASRRTLIRRAYYDLTGLPPSPAEVEAFARDESPEAWGQLIDTLLDSPRYGEKWARHWLDIVRYAETNGFERDSKKPHIWRYRDYVIKAFNKDKPYDRFIVEQLAGDEIDEPTEDSLTATGFHRLMQWDDEPADRKQHTYDVLADNLAMTADALLGTSMGCARCHDHKADPISQKDYYSFMAFFHGVKPYAKQGTLVTWTGDDDRGAQQAKGAARVTALERDLSALEDQIESYLEEHGFIDRNRGKVPTFVEDASSGGATWEYTTREPTPDWIEVGFRDKSWIQGRGGFGRKGTPGAIVNTPWDTDAIWMRTSFGLKTLPDSLVLEIHHDDEVEVYLNGIEVFRGRDRLKDYTVVGLDKSALDALQTGKNVVAVHCRQQQGGQFIDLALRAGQPQAKDIEQIVKREGTTLVNALTEHFQHEIWRDYKKAQKEFADLEKTPPGTQINAVTETGAHPQPLHVHLRGSAHALGDPVVPAFPAVLSGTDEPRSAALPDPAPTKKTSGRRRVLAEWIASPDNPLTARVIVNRLWQHHFGRGIVASASDFGQLGEKPTHPELLDWLATELVRRNWSLKEMHRLIMTSQAYRMSSAPREDALAADPQNDLFWRFNMRRLTAEELRDSILAVSGNLNLKSGGESVFPPLPPEVLATSSRPHAAWGESPPEEAARRSIYAHVKRSMRIPMLAEHDQADTDSPCAVRFATTVPTQTLGMLNSQFVNDQASLFAERLRKIANDNPEAQVRKGLALALQRPAENDEVRHCVEFMERMQNQAGLSPAEALDRFALLALNLNEFIYLD